MMSLLIVDDDARMRSLIRSIVADLADPITECGNGAEAQKRYAEHKPDWVLMDVMMPEVGGLEATRQIIASYPAARIVMVTGQESQSLREAAAIAGAYAFVSKENLLELRELIESGNCLSV
jgi:two-component system chemotaxis response regulator CheY